MINGSFEIWKLSSPVQSRYRVEHSKINFISPRAHVLFSIYQIVCAHDPGPEFNNLMHQKQFECFLTARLQTVPSFTIWCSVHVPTLEQVQSQNIVQWIAFCRCYLKFHCQLPLHFPSIKYKSCSHSHLYEPRVLTHLWNSSVQLYKSSSRHSLISN